MKKQICSQLKLHLVNLLFVFLLLNFQSTYSKSIDQVLFQQNNFTSFFSPTTYFDKSECKINFFESNTFLFVNTCLNLSQHNKYSAEYLYAIDFKNIFDHNTYNLSSITFSFQLDKIVNLNSSKNKINTINEYFELINYTVQNKNNDNSFMLIQKYSTAYRIAFSELSVAFASGIILI